MKNMRLIRPLSLVVLIVFIITTVSWGMPASSVVSVATRTETHLVQDIQIDPRNGIVDGAYEGKGNVTVAIVQDVHCNYNAQVHEAEIIKNLVEHYGFEAIYLEGAVGHVDTALFSAYPEKDIKENIFQEALRSGDINGADYYAIMRHDTFTWMHGIENKSLYERNFNAALAVSRIRNLVSSDVKKSKNSCLLLKRLIYSNELFEFDTLMNSSDWSDNDNPNNKEASVELLKQILLYAAQYALPCEQYPEIRKIKDNSNNSYWEHTIYMRQLIDDIASFSNYVRTMLFRNEEERMINQYWEKLSLLERGLNLQLTKRDMAPWKSLLSLPWDTYLTIGASHGVAMNMDVHHLNEAVTAVETFYECVENRDEAMIQNVSSYIRENKQKKVVLVVGGFHTQQFTDAFKDHDFSWITIAPVVDQRVLNNSYYLDHLASTSANGSTMMLVSAVHDPIRVRKLFVTLYMQHIVQYGNMAEEDFKAMIINEIRKMQRVPSAELSSLISQIDGIVLPRMACSVSNQHPDNTIIYFDSAYNTEELCGGKAVSLSEMSTIRNVTVYPGFTLTGDAYESFIQTNNVDAQLRTLQKLVTQWVYCEIMRNSDRGTTLYGTSDVTISEYQRNVESELNTLLSTIREMIKHGVFPDFLDAKIRAIIQQYEKETTYSSFAVRSSAPKAEDLTDASFAGQQDSFLNQIGEEAVLKSAKAVFASLFSERAMMYRMRMQAATFMRDICFDRGNEYLFDSIQKRMNNDIWSPLKLRMAVIVQRMVTDATASGVAFSVNPEDGRSLIRVESTVGLGSNVDGIVVPDWWLVDPCTMKIVDRGHGRKNKKIVLSDAGGISVVPTTMVEKKGTSLTDDEVINVACGLMEIKKYFIEKKGWKECECEFAVSHKDGLIFNQARSETVFSQESETTVLRMVVDTDAARTARVIMRGGMRGFVSAVSGKVLVLDDYEQFIESGGVVTADTIVVAPQTNNQWNVLLIKAGGMLTEMGGISSHTAIVSREWKKPAIIGIDGLVENLKLYNGEWITIDPYHLVIYEGKLPLHQEKIDLTHMTKSEHNDGAFDNIMTLREKRRAWAKKGGYTDEAGVWMKAPRHPLGTLILGVFHDGYKMLGEQFGIRMTTKVAYESKEHAFYDEPLHWVLFDDRDGLLPLFDSFNAEKLEKIFYEKLDATQDFVHLSDSLGTSADDIEQWLDTYNRYMMYRHLQWNMTYVFQRKLHQEGISAEYVTAMIQWLREGNMPEDIARHYVHYKPFPLETEKVIQSLDGIVQQIQSLPPVYGLCMSDITEEALLDKLVNTSKDVHKALYTHARYFKVVDSTDPRITIRKRMIRTLKDVCLRLHNGVPSKHSEKKGDVDILRNLSDEQRILLMIAVLDSIEKDNALHIMVRAQQHYVDKLNALESRLFSAGLLSEKEKVLDLSRDELLKKVALLAQKDRKPKKSRRISLMSKKLRYLHDPGVQAMYAQEVNELIPLMKSREEAYAYVLERYKKGMICPEGAVAIPNANEYYALTRELILEEYEKGIPCPTFNYIHLVAALFEYLERGLDDSLPYDAGQRLKYLLKKHNIRNVLEIGPSGNLTFAYFIHDILKGVDGHLTLVDLDEGNEPARASGITVVRGDVARMPDKSYDLIFGSGVFSRGGVGKVGVVNSITTANSLLNQVMNRLTDNPRAGVFINTLRSIMMLDKETVETYSDIYLWDYGYRDKLFNFDTLVIQKERKRLQENDFGYQYQERRYQNLLNICEMLFIYGNKRANRDLSEYEQRDEKVREVVSAWRKKCYPDGKFTTALYSGDLIEGLVCVKPHNDGLARLENLRYEGASTAVVMKKGIDHPFFASKTVSTDETSENSLQAGSRGDYLPDEINAALKIVDSDFNQQIARSGAISKSVARDNARTDSIMLALYCTEISSQMVRSLHAFAREGDDIVVYFPREASLNLDRLRELRNVPGVRVEPEFSHEKYGEVLSFKNVIQSMGNSAQASLKDIRVFAPEHVLLTLNQFFNPEARPLMFLPEDSGGVYNQEAESVLLMYAFMDTDKLAKRFGSVIDRVIHSNGIVAIQINLERYPQYDISTIAANLLREKIDADFSNNVYRKAA